LKHKSIPLVKSLTEAYQAGAPYASAGWVFVVSIAVCMALGWWLDGRLDTKPVFTICGSFAGIGFGIYNLVILIKQIDKSKKDKENITG